VNSIRSIRSDGVVEKSKKKSTSFCNGNQLNLQARRSCMRVTWNTSQGIACVNKRKSDVSTNGGPTSLVLSDTSEKSTNFMAILASFAILAVANGLHSSACEGANFFELDESNDNTAGTEKEPKERIRLSKKNKPYDVSLNKKVILFLQLLCCCNNRPY
jgi:hypothetical protein